MIATTIVCVLEALLGADEPRRPGQDGTTAVVVRCRAEALVRGADVLVRDVATVECGDQELSARVGEIVLANRPAVGNNRVFPAGDIKLRLVASGLLAAQISMAGAIEVVVQPLATLLAPKDFTDVCDPVLQALLAARGGDVEFEPTAKPAPLRVPPGRFDLSLRAKLRDGQLQPCSAVIDCEIVVDGEAWKTVPISYRLRHFVQALQTTRVLKAGEPLTDQNLELQRIEVPAGTNMHLTSWDLVAGRVAARDVQNGASLRLADVKRPAIVRKNDLVTLLARRGRIQVATKAIALADAAVEERVVVRSLSTNKPVQAVVLSAGLVEIPN